MRWPGLTSSRLVPRLEICVLMACVAPLPSVTMVITALTPMTMPRMVRNERSRLRRTERRASMKTLYSIRSASAGAARRRPAAGATSVGLALITSLAMRPSTKVHHAPRVGGHVGLVGHHQHGDAVVAVQRQQQAHDLVAALGVEVAGGFVGQHHGGLGDDGARNGHALLLAARQFGRRVVFPAAQAHRLASAFARGGAARGRRCRRGRAAAARRSPAPRCAPAG
jgi:hypothetical protein